MNSAETDDPLGQLMEASRPTWANIIAGSILSLLLLGSGIAVAGFFLLEIYRAKGNLPFNAEKGMCWVAVIFGAVLIFILLLAGYALADYVRSLATLGIEWHEHGFRSRSDEGVREVAWQEIAKVLETFIYERPPILVMPFKLLVPHVLNKRYTVTTHDGEVHCFDNNLVNNLKFVETLLRLVADREQIPWEVVEDREL